QPGRTSGQFSGIGFPTDTPPFTPDELLAKAVKEKVAPKLLITNGSHEYWGRAAGLNHVSADGKPDVEPSSGLRIYYFAGTQHGNGGMPNALVQNPTNNMDWTFFMRNMVVVMNDWITSNTPPPPSRFPHISSGTLVPVAKLAFPKLPNVNVVREAYVPAGID